MPESFSPEQRPSKLSRHVMAVLTTGALVKFLLLDLKVPRREFPGALLYVGLAALTYWTGYNYDKMGHVAGEVTNHADELIDGANQLPNPFDASVIEMTPIFEEAESRNTHTNQMQPE